MPVASGGGAFGWSGGRVVGELSRDQQLQAVGFTVRNEDHLRVRNLCREALRQVQALDPALRLLVLKGRWQALLLATLLQRERLRG